MIKEVTEKEKQAFNNAVAHPLQAWEWGEFREKAGNKIVRLGVFENGRLISSLQLTVHHIPFTDYKIGALIKGPEPTQEILDSLKDLAKKEKLIFIKMEPNVVKNVHGEQSTVNSVNKIVHQPLNTGHSQKLIALLHKNNCVPGKTLFTPTTFWIDLAPSEDELLKSFHSKTRYNIRLAQKKGVTVVEDNSDEAFERYLELTRETVERQGFYAHTEHYHRLMWEYLYKRPIDNGQSLSEPEALQSRRPIAHLLTAKYKGEIITTWIVFTWHDFLYYPYGASTDKYKDVMANNLVMWEAIRFGKKLGLKTFDLWGREEGKGFTKFKEGYNPKVVEFLGTWDLPTSSLYPFYTKAELLRWKLLRLRSKLNFTKPTF